MTILYLTFYFEPDLCPGSFRNTPLVSELARQLTAADSIQVITTHPNRYASYTPVAADSEEWTTADCPVRVRRIRVPAHKSGLVGQMFAFGRYFRLVRQLAREAEYDLVFASSSRLFTAFLGATLARKRRIPLVLDIRDLFREAIAEVVRFPPAQRGLNLILKLAEHYTFGYATHINLVSKGFHSYFGPYRQATYSYCTNGIDTAFLDMPPSNPAPEQPYKTILYAGNIGDGQGLHKLIPEAARQLGNSFRFVVIGDGGARPKLEAALQQTNTPTVSLLPPTDRQALLAAYHTADYLLVHLNDWEACRRVLPSKLFEYGATDKPILAGVRGYAASFVCEHLPNAYLFAPADVDGLVKQLRSTPYRTQERTEFKRRFGRQAINEELAGHIVRALNRNALAAMAASKHNALVS